MLERRIIRMRSKQTVSGASLDGSGHGCELAGPLAMAGRILP